MKSIAVSNVPGVSRILQGLVAAVTLVAASSSVAKSVGQVPVFLYNQTFGKGKEIHADSGAKRINASSIYKYTLNAKVRATPGSRLEALVGKGVSVTDFIESLSPGGSKYLSGTFTNPGGKLPVTVLDKTFKGTKTIKGVGPVKISLKVVARILQNGQCVLDVTNVKLKTTPKTKLGSFKFMAGSRLQISAAPSVEFKRKNNVIAENAGSVVVPVWRVTNTHGTATVKFSTVNGTADGDDYEATSGTITFGDGEMKKEIVIPIKDNAINDTSRQFTIKLSDPGTFTTLGNSTTTLVTIIDNE